MTVKSPASLTKGELFYSSGAWVVDRVSFDPHGNTGHDARYIIHCHAPPWIQPRHPGLDHMQIGLGVGTHNELVQVINPKLTREMVSFLGSLLKAFDTTGPSYLHIDQARILFSKTR